MVRHPRDSAPRKGSGQAEKSGSRPRSDSKARSGPKPAGAKTEAGAKPQPRPERIAKALARAGIASRREVERLINLGKVAVNGRLLDSPAVLVTRDDIVTVDGVPVNEPEPTRVWRYHKPVGLVTTHRDPYDRPTVFEHLPEGLPRVLSVGRLDLNSEGLLLLTNDGELARALELPSNGWRRVYRARALGRTSQETLDTLKDGVTVDGVSYGPIEAKLDKAKEAKEGGANVWITVSLHEGKYREVRKVLESIGLKVNRLIRLAYGPFQLGTLEQGAAEEVGPRVIREQLAEFIAPENLPKGDRVASGPTKPGRRPEAASKRPRPTDPVADPSKKPSRLRAGAEAEAAKAERATRPGPRERRREAERAEGGDRPARPQKKPGWAKAGPRPERPARPRKPREDGAPRPERTFGATPEGGERPYRPSTDAETGGYGYRERPARETKPREGADRPRGPRRDPEEGASFGDRPKRPYKPRGDGGAPTERPARAFGQGGDERPKRAYKPRDGGDAPRGERPSRGFGQGGGDGERPKRAYKPRAEGDGPRSGERPSRGFGQDGGDGERPKRAYKPRAEGDRPERSFGDKPKSGGFKGPRAGGKPAGPGRGYGGPRGGKPGGKPSGPRTPRPPRGG